MKAEANTEPPNMAPFPVVLDGCFFSQLQLTGSRNSIDSPSEQFKKGGADGIEKYY